jgi:mRNA-degrading endonuclease RelE of RelBE toxin-antitoxin system
LAKLVEYKASVEKDLKKISAERRTRVIAELEKNLLDNERKSKALTGAFKGLHRIRVGEYRAIYARTAHGFLVLRIAHRKDVYRD